MNVYGDVVFNGDVGVNGDLVMQPAATVKVRTIDPVDNETSVQIGGDLYFNPVSTIFLLALFSPTTTPLTIAGMSHFVLGSLVNWM